jgi:hypothetical protein
MVGALAAGFTVLLAATVAMAQSTGVATETTLTTQSLPVGNHEVTTYSARVVGEDGTPATGVVHLMEQGRDLASAALSSAGQAEIRFDSLPAGDHALHAVYAGDSTHATSQSETVAVHADASTTAGSDFALSIAVVGGSSPTTMTIAAPGDSGSLVATVTPTAGAGFTGFLSLSCSGASVSTGAAGGSALPVGVVCVFTPANLQILAPSSANPTAVAKADMNLQTAASQQTVAAKLEKAPSHGHGAGAPLALAILLPGILGVGLLGRKRKMFFRVTMLAFVGVLGVLGTASCNARYRYLNHGPYFTGTPPGTYTVTITAQTSDGVTASLQSQTLTLVVNQ